MQKILLIDNADNLMVALKDLHKGERVSLDAEGWVLITDVPAKHKFAMEDVPAGGVLRLYGVPVAKAVKDIARGEAVTVDNIRHHAAETSLEDTAPYLWQGPDVAALAQRTFAGVVREDGRVGTANYWLVIPLVFCENRNAVKLASTLSQALGYADVGLSAYASALVGGTALEAAPATPRRFKNLDGIRAITHHGGCGGTAFDCESLCHVLAAYADHPNVAGITVFSLGCEKSQIDVFKKALARRNPAFSKPALYFLQQEWDSEPRMMEEALRQTWELLPAADAITRRQVPLSHLKVGVKCGGSDGFSGISANPAMGLVSDMLVALGGASGLAEFPELCGAEGSLLVRCDSREKKKKFLDLMGEYEKAANFFHTSIADNPSPGNIRDGLITDAIKSTGAAKKGGTAPVAAVLDYAEAMPDSGLSLVCTPGNDVESVTGLVAAGANVVIFSTGLGTPTGNPIVPVLKISTNTAIAERLGDMIDFDCGPIIEGRPMQEVADALLEKVVATASGQYTVKADLLEQYDFMLWQRNVSL